MAPAVDGSENYKRQTIFGVARPQFLILLSIAIVALIVYAVFAMPVVRVFSQRISEHADVMRNAAVRAEFVPIPTELIQKNNGLRVALSCADWHYQILELETSLPMPVDPVCETGISIYEANMIKTEIPIFSMDGQYLYQIKFDNKYYWVSIPPT
jgi:hypothetical protein